MNNATPKGDGYIEFDSGLQIPRERLAETLSDIQRFERCLSDAQKLNADMTANDGQPPEYITTWNKPYLDDVVATIRDIGKLHSYALADMEVEKVRRYSS